jgi:hypothetical protein
MYDSDNIYLQGNVLINDVQGVSGVYDDRRTTHHSFWISDNTINSFYRMGVEVAAYWTRDLHTDRNMITWSKGGIGLSIVTGGGQSVQDTSHANGTIMGNIENSVSGSGGWGIELAVPNLNVESNTMTNVDHPMVISSSPNAVIFNNIVSGANGISSEDGGYESNFWVGSNTLDGQNIIGWSGHGLTSQPETNYAPSIPACAAR